MSGVPAGPTLVLEVSARDTVIETADGVVRRLPVGTTTLWTPSPEAIELGIQTVEDAIEGMATDVPRGATMRLSAGVLAPLQRDGANAALAAGSIGVADVEREYQMLAARAQGAPSARGTGFDDPAGDALVLILRELMHHLSVVSLQTRD